MHDTSNPHVTDSLETRDDVLDFVAIGIEKNHVKGAQYFTHATKLSGPRCINRESGGRFRQAIAFLNIDTCLATPLVGDFFD